MPAQQSEAAKTSRPKFRSPSSSTQPIERAGALRRPRDDQGVVQAPSEQSWSGAQRIPHPPQWFRSLRVLTHSPPQSVKPSWQTHPPSTQAVFGPQLAPQAPQWFGSRARSTQAPLQLSKPIEQVQAPSRQTRSEPQVFPQPPQFCGSLCRSRQTPSQKPLLAGQ
jgi:hypothetical protein